ncbi:MAG: hypothetical protein ACI9HK_002980 [Pirellulaceae bacterium]|jgi:hypothetical protein
MLDWLTQKTEWLLEKIENPQFNPQSIPVSNVVYLATAIIAYLCLASTFSLDFFGRSWLVLFLLASFAVLRIWLVPWLLLLLMVDLVLTERPTTFGDLQSVDNLIYAAIVLVFVSAASRYVVLAGTVLPFHSASLTGKLGAVVRRFLPASMRSDPVGLQPREKRTFSAVELVTGLVRVALAVLLAATIMSAIPADVDTPRNIGLLPTAVRTVRIGGTLLVGALAVYYVVEAISWQLMTKSEARIFLRSVITEETSPDISRVVRYQLQDRFVRLTKK